MGFYAFDNMVPQIDASAYIHPDAIVIGAVFVGKNCFVGAGAVLRGDFGTVILEDGANFQETCVAHSFPNKNVTIAQDAHIGHGAVLHGCHIGKNAMIGMNAVIMDDAKIGENSIIGALSFVKAETEIPANQLAFGNPAKIIRPLTAEEIAWKTQGTQLYQDLAQAKLCKACEPNIGGENQSLKQFTQSYETLKATRENTQPTK